MGIVLRFSRRRRHARSSSTRGLKPKTDGSTVIPWASKASLISRKFSGGISPRTRQLTTAEGRTAATAEVLVGPPRASITASTEVSIPVHSSRNVKMSSLHRMGIVTNCELGPNVPAMRTIPDIAERLVATQVALGKSQAELCRLSGLTETQWTQFTKPEYKRRITLACAYKLKDAFGVTLEWIYDGDRSRLPHDLAQKLREAA